MKYLLVLLVLTGCGQTPPGLSRVVTTRNVAAIPTAALLTHDYTLLIYASNNQYDVSASLDDAINYPSHVAKWIHNPTDGRAVLELTAPSVNYTLASGGTNQGVFNYCLFKDVVVGASNDCSQAIQTGTIDVGAHDIHGVDP